MFSLFGAEESIKNIYRVSHPYIGSNQISTAGDLKEFYLEFISNHQPYMPISSGDELFVKDESVELALARAYSGDNVLDDLNQAKIIGHPYSNVVRRQKTEIAKEALADFLGLDDLLAAVFNLAVHSIFITPSTVINDQRSYGGSSSSAIGAIWMTVDEEIKKIDLMEMFLHELTHHLLFIDEHSHSYFDYAEIAREENYALSAILKKRRPLDKVVHSIVVGTELILGRRQFLPTATNTIVHPSTEELLRDTMLAYSSIQALPNIDKLLKPRTLEILERCKSHCFESVTA